MWARGIFGALLCALGGVWIFQGVGVLHGSVMTGEEALERLDEVGLRSRTGLHQGHAGGCMRREHVEQPVAPAPAEGRRLVRKVDDLTARRVQFQQRAIHRRSGARYVSQYDTAPP